jgi:hypothetical protein
MAQLIRIDNDGESHQCWFMWAEYIRLAAVPPLRFTTAEGQYKSASSRYQVLPAHSTMRPFGAEIA